MTSKFYTSIVIETLKDLVNLLVKNLNILSKINTSLSSNTIHNSKWFLDSIFSINMPFSLSSSSIYNFVFNSLSLSNKNSKFTFNSKMQDYKIENIRSELFD